VKYLFWASKHNIDQEKAFKCYDGYKASIGPNLKIFNPWSIVRFLESKTIGNYLEKTGNIDFIKNIFKKTENITSIIDLLFNKIITNDRDSDKEPSLDIYSYWFDHLYLFVVFQHAKILFSLFDRFISLSAASDYYSCFL
jgi:hypothetical protein